MREVREEIGVELPPEDCTYFEGYYVRYSDYDFVYHVYHVTLKEEPALTLNPAEHKDFRWLTPQEALTLNLIQDEDACIKWFYGM